VLSTLTFEVLPEEKKGQNQDSYKMKVVSERKSWG
jgi:hypothetical protein